jgi:hypothetical protein
MKRIILYAFSVAFTVVSILSSGEARSQDKKEVRRTIIINDGDTIINGKKLSDANPSERKVLLKELNDNKKKVSEKKVIRKRKDGKEEKETIIRKGDKEPRVLRWRSENDGEGHAGVFKFDNDSLLLSFGDDSLRHAFRFQMDGLDSNVRNRVMSLNRSMRSVPRKMEGTHPRLFMDENEMFDRTPLRRENSQAFNYVSTDKDGISSRMSIQLSKPSGEILKKINAGSDKAMLNVNDLTISPNFSNGKLNLTFSTTDKGPAEVNIFDSSLKQIFSDKTANVNGTYFKQISLPMNGVYYIRIAQGGKTFVRKMIKEN